MSNSKPNLYRQDLDSHKKDASNAYTTMCGTDGRSNPCSSVAKMISNGAWVSKTATDWCTDIETLGGYIKTSFANYSRDVTSAVNSEPKEIDLDTDPDNAWKTTWTT